MSSKHYDIIVVGAGPAGLGAARTAARLGFRTLVLERLNGAGDLSHPCGAIVAPLQGLVSVDRLPHGLLFPELDLFVASAHITGYLPHQTVVSPGGQRVTIPLAAWPGGPVAVVDKAWLLIDMAQAAELAGAELRYGVAATGLVYRGNRVSGVRTFDGPVTADIVLAAEGAARQLTEEAGLYAGAPPSRRHAFIASMDLEAPGAGPGDVGQIITLGRRHTSARDSFGAIVVPAPGLASAYFTLFADGPGHYTDRSLWFYLDEYIHHDPRINALFAGSTVVGGSSYRLMLRSGPARAVRDGLIAMGDALAPGGHLGILPSIYLGRHAALTAAGALDAGDVTSARLSGYEQVLQAPVFAGLDAEREQVLALMHLPDAEIDDLCTGLGVLDITSTLIPGQRPSAWRALASVGSRSPLAGAERSLPHRMINGAYWPATAERLGRIGAGAQRGR